MTIREDPLKRLGALVSAARKAVRGEKGKPLNRSVAALQMGLSRQILINIEDGKPLLSSTAEAPCSASPESYVVIEEFFDWEPGSIARYLRENGPEPGPAEARSVNLLDLGDESLSDLDVPTLLGGFVAEWLGRVSPSRRNHAAQMVVDFIKSLPNRRDEGD